MKPDIDINENDFDIVDELRKRYNLTWEEAFQRLAMYTNGTSDVFKLPPELSDCDGMSIASALSMLPMWVNNVAESLPTIRSSKNLTDIPLATNTPALIISGGPSLYNTDVLDVLEDEGFNGDIFAVGRVLKTLLDREIIPKYVGFLDAEQFDTTFIDYEIVDEYADEMTALMGTVVHPTTVRRWPGEIAFYNGWVPDWATPNISHMLHLFTNKIVMNVGGNVGSALWNISVMFENNPIGMIGMDLGFESFEDMCNYHAHVPREKIEETYKKYTHPVWGNEVYVSQVFNVYKTATESWIKAIRANGGQITYNCTGKGSLWDGMECVSLKEFLDLCNGSN